MRRTSTIAAVLAGMFLSCGALPGEHYSFIQYGPIEGLNSAVKQVVQDGTGS
jgi:hypothetical protein